jgi:hypothetical protein
MAFGYWDPCCGFYILVSGAPRFEGKIKYYRWPSCNGYSRKKGPYPEYLVINIVNTGHRDVQITYIGWKVGFFKEHRQHAIQIIEPNGLSSNLPLWLRYGEQANYYIPLGITENGLWAL